MKKPNYMAHFVFGFALMTASIYSVFADAGKQPAGSEHMIEELRKDHSNERY